MMDPIGKTIAQYQILEPISSYGMGIVYKAVDTLLDRTVALKLLPPGFMNDSVQKKRFHREAQTAGALDHPNICTVHEFGVSDTGQPFLVMPYYRGKTLEDKITGGPIPVREVIRIATQIAEGLQAAHAAGIIHRDIKPANIMITEQHIVKILDFGLAKHHDKAISQAGDIVGTAAYMSPEQAMGQPVDPRTDIFSFGMILYEMLTGKHPFAREHAHAILYAILNEEPDFRPELFPGVPGEFLDIIKKMLAKEPGDRYKSITVALAEFKSLMKSMRIRQSQQIYGREKTWRKVASVFASGLVIVLMTFGIYHSESARHSSVGDQSAPSAGDIPTLAVLPLVNLSGDTEQAYFVDGFTEQLITDLAKIRSLRIISRTSIMHYKNTEKRIPEIAKELHADYIVEGSVISEGNRVRITIQLIHTPTDQHIWAESYEREVRGILDIQREIALAVAQEIHLNLTIQDRERINTPVTTKPEAYDAYLWGRYSMNHFTVEGWQQAIESFNKAISLDPRYASAYVNLASAYFFLTVFGVIPSNEGQRSMTRALNSALQIDADNGMAAMLLSLKYQFFDLDWINAEKAIRKALDLSPGISDVHREYGWLLGRTGRLEEALIYMKKSLELDPYSVQSFHSLSQIYYYLRDYDQAIHYARIALEIEPNAAFAYDDLGWALIGKSQFETALQAFRKKAGLLGQETSSDIGYVYAVTGRKEEARSLVKNLSLDLLRGRSTNHEIGRVYLGLGEVETALDYFERSVERRESFTVLLKVAPWMDPVRTHPRYQQLLTRAGLL